MKNILLKNIINWHQIILQRYQNKKISKQKGNCWFCKKDKLKILKNLNKKVTSNKTRHIKVKIKLNDLEEKKVK